MKFRILIVLALISETTLAGTHGGGVESVANHPAPRGGHELKAVLGGTGGGGLLRSLAGNGQGNMKVALCSTGGGGGGGVVRPTKNGGSGGSMITLGTSNY